MGKYTMGAVHITRYEMYRRVRQHRGFGPGLALSISRSERLCRLMGFEDGQIVRADWPAVDMLALPFCDGVFDLVASDQVLEHVQGEPGRAVAESFRVARPGGLVIHTSCCMNPLHEEEPGDFWRFTPAGLAYLAGQYGEVLEAGGWGNPLVDVWVGIRRLEVPARWWSPARWLATTNWSRGPVVVWVVGRKGSE